MSISKTAKDFSELPPAGKIIALALSAAVLFWLFGGDGDEMVPPEAIASSAAPVGTPHQCRLRIPGRNSEVPGYTTEAAFDQSYKLAEKGASDRIMLRHLVSDGGKMIPPNTKCEIVGRVGLLAVRVSVIEGTFAGREFIVPLEWAHSSE